MDIAEADFPHPLRQVSRTHYTTGWLETSEDSRYSDVSFYLYPTETRYAIQMTVRWGKHARSSHRPRYHHRPGLLAKRMRSLCDAHDVLPPDQQPEQ